MAECAGAVPPIDILNFACQTPEERFSEFEFLQDVHQDAQNYIHQLPINARTTCLDGAPKPSFWRMNLVALSQKFNMHFAAYKDTIHITRPRTLKQIIPGVPDLILRLPISEKAGRGHLNDRPHCVNNMMIGNLGSKEILLFCTDDGDVTAYYTQLLAEELQRQTMESTVSSIPIGETRPFFLENVGDSAWGLAIHEKSRLIAVSSNKKEVTVFVHGTYSKEGCNCALTGTVLDPIFERLEQHSGSLRRFPAQSCPAKRFVYVSSRTFGRFPVRVSPKDIRNSKSRNEGLCSRNFRLLLRPNQRCSNIPAITFANDKLGLAESIIATDILGNMWLLRIWQDYQELIEPRLPQGKTGPSHLMGWGVMTIPLQYFKYAASFEDALGIEDFSPAFNIDELSLNKTGYMDITSSMRRIELFPRILQAAVERPASPPAEGDLPVHDVSTAAFVNEAISIILESFPENLANNGIFDEDWLNELIQGHPLIHDEFGDPLLILRRSAESICHIDGTVIQNSSVIPQEQGLENSHSNSPPNWLKGLEYIKKDRLIPDHPRSLQYALPRFETVKQYRKLVAVPDKNPESILSDGSVILRTWQDSMELLPSFPHMPATICSKGFFRQGTPRAFGQSFRHISRINMMALIPELSLLVVASQDGQAALLTLTAVEVDFCEAPATSLRLEALLPPRQYNEQYLVGYDGPKPPLLGLAVSPIPKGVGIELEAGEHPDKWRLVMQSYDHTIWTYELSRDEKNHLNVF